MARLPIEKGLAYRSKLVAIRHESFDPLCFSGLGGTLRRGPPKEREAIMKAKLDSILHEDRTVSYWSVLRQTWVLRASTVDDEESDTWLDTDRCRVLRHLAGNDDRCPECDEVLANWPKE